jgi:SPP1 family predicted phage head-tail adaptor
MAGIGAMRESLALQSNAEVTSTGTGRRTASWSTYATVPGEYLQPSVGNEQLQQSAVVANLGPRFRIRYRTDVVPKHRLTWRGQVLQIHAVIPVMKVGNRFLELQTGATQ